MVEMKIMIIIGFLLLSVSAIAVDLNPPTVIKTFKAPTQPRPGVQADQVGVWCIDGYKWIVIYHSEYRQQITHIKQMTKSGGYYTVPVPCTD